MTAVIAVPFMFLVRCRFGPARGCQTSRHLAAARRASQRQLLDVGDGPNGAGGWENRKRLRKKDAEMRREEKREERRVSGGGEKNLAGSRHAAPQKITRKQTEP
jgi:hypothetical protein